MYNSLNKPVISPINPNELLEVYATKKTVYIKNLQLCEGSFIIAYKGLKVGNNNFDRLVTTDKSPDIIITERLILTPGFYLHDATLVVGRILNNKGEQIQLSFATSTVNSLNNLSLKYSPLIPPEFSDKIWKFEETQYSDSQATPLIFFCSSKINDFTKDSQSYQIFNSGETHIMVDQDIARAALTLVGNNEGHEE